MFGCACKHPMAPVRLHACAKREGGPLCPSGVRLQVTRIRSKRLTTSVGRRSQEKMKERDKEYFGKKLPKGGINGNGNKRR